MIDFKEGNLNPVIEKSFNVAVHYLRSVHQRIFKLMNYNESSIEDLAIDAITPLFTSNGNSELPFKTAFNNWSPTIETEEEFLFFLVKVVSKRVEQHIAYLLKESDPLFSTILNSLNYLIKKNGHTKTKYLGKVYIIESGTKKIKGKVITEEVFNSIPASQFTENKKFLQNIFYYIKTETDFFPAIPVNALVFRFKELKSSGYNFEEKLENPARTYELTEFVRKGLSAAEAKLYNTYVAHEKLARKEAQKFIKVLKDISEDLMKGGVSPGLYGYLKPYFDNLSAEEYRKKYHNKLEYLFKVMRNTIADELKK